MQEHKNKKYSEYEPAVSSASFHLHSLLLDDCCFDAPVCGRYIQVNTLVGRKLLSDEYVGKWFFDLDAIGCSQ